MPKLLTPKKDDTASNSPICNFSQPTQNVLAEQLVPIEELKQRCDRYLTYLNSLQPAQGSLMVRAANFTTDSILQLIQQSPGSAFIRVYYGIDANGEHGLFMAPVTETGATMSTEEALFVDDCCACPPMGNCPDDELLTQEP